MDKARRLLKRKQSYEAIRNDTSTGYAEENDPDKPQSTGQTPYSRLEYAIYLLLGVAMLWAWNMFLAAAPYFQRRFRSNTSLLSNFQAAEVSISTLANLGSMLILTKLQATANYPRRIIFSLVINIAGFALLALSTKAFTAVSATAYFVFAMVMVFVSSTATGFMQNGAFAYAAGMGRPEYIQGIMMGQAVAGVLPPLVQIASVLTVADAEEDGGGAAGQQSSTSALAYFMTATGVAGFTLFAFFYLLRRHAAAAKWSLPNEAAADPQSTDTDQDSTVEDDTEHSSHSGRPHHSTTTSPAPESIPFYLLWRRLSHISSAVFLTFAITMVFPVFTQEILSVHTPTSSPSSSPSTSSPLFRPAAFIPIAFLFWNTGDLLGRLIPLWPALSLAHRPRVLLLLATLRVLFVPLYTLCNIQPGITSDPSFSFTSAGIGATVRSDAFYLLLVQLPFGLTNGYVGNCCMMGAGACVEEEEREAAGSFMGLMLVAGLAVGSLCSFFVGGA